MAFTFSITQSDGDAHVFQVERRPERKPEPWPVGKVVAEGVDVVVQWPNGRKSTYTSCALQLVSET